MPGLAPPPAQTSAHAGPTISVIVAMRNAMPFLPQALSSLMEQTVPALEVVVIDGGSSDGSREYAAAVTGVLPTPQTGRGLAQARNQGLRLARGDLIAFLDTDDYWAPGWLASATASLLAQPTSDCVLGQIVRFLHEGADLPPSYAGGWLDRPAAGYTPGAMLARRCAFARVGGFDESLAIGCDSDWFVRAIDGGLRMEHLARIALHKRIHGQNLSAQVERYRRELLTVTRRSLQRRQLLTTAPEPS